MKTITELAREAGMVVYEGDQDRVLFDGRILEALQRFHDLAIAQCRESLLAGVGEAVAWRVRCPAMGSGYKWVMNDKPVMQADGFVNERLFNADQMAAAVAIEREWLRKCLLVMEREAKWAFDDLNEEPDVLNADIAALKEHLK